MEYDTRTYFTEHEQDAVKGFTIIGTDESEGYHVAEKWLKQDADDVWMDYWIPEAQLERRTEAGECEPKGKLTAEQYGELCQIVGMDNWDMNGEDVEA